MKNYTVALNINDREIEALADELAPLQREHDRGNPAGAHRTACKVRKCFGRFGSLLAIPRVSGSSGLAACPGECE